LGFYTSNDENMKFEMGGVDFVSLRIIELGYLLDEHPRK